MSREAAEALTAEASAMAQWRAMLRNDVALLAKPGAHHKTLLRQAHAMHKSGVIDSDDLSDLLEQADEALAFAVESLLDVDRDE